MTIISILLQRKRGIELEKNDLQIYNSIYNELADLIGSDNMKKVYDNFAGTQVSFPAKLYTKDYVIQQVIENYNGKNARELAKKYGYTVKYLNQIIKESLVISNIKT